MVSTLEEFLSEIGEADCEFLSLRELDRFLPVCCGMANGDGGWIVPGVACADGELRLEGETDVVSLERRLRVSLRNSRSISADPSASFRTLSSGGRKLLAVQVAPADWRKRPVRAGDFVWRRVEGEDVASGRSMRVRMALDALEVLRDDHPVGGSLSDLNAGDVASFREAVLRRRPLWDSLSDLEFLKRALVLDEFGTPVRAGQLLLGTGAPVRAVLRDRSPEILEFRNLWSACTELLPRLCENLSGPCADAVRECFLNAMIHADHDAGCVRVDRDGTALSVSNPGLPRTDRPGESVPRNFRLLRMFELAGLARGEGEGLEIVREFEAAFSLRRDVLELATVADLSLETVAGGAAESGDAAIPESGPGGFGDAADSAPTDPGWMALLKKAVPETEDAPAPQEAPAFRELVTKGSSYAVFSIPETPSPGGRRAAAEEAEPPADIPEEEPAELPPQEEVPSAKETAVPETPPAAEGPAEEIPIEQPIPEQPAAEFPPPGEPEVFVPEDPHPGKTPVFGDAACELESYVSSLKVENGEGDAAAPSGGGEETSSLVRMVRETPRLQAALVQDAILELCSEYRSIPELAALLSRSENSLRRHYLTSMVRQGLLELEHPEAVGHPDQRYRVPQS